MASNVGATSCPEDQAEQRRRTEAKQLIEQIEGHDDGDSALPWTAHHRNMTVNDALFFDSIKRWAYREVSVRQLDWLRDIRDRYVLGTGDD